MHRPNDTQFASMGCLEQKITKYLLDNHRTSAQCRLIKGNTTVINSSQFPKYSCRTFEVSCDNKKINGGQLLSYHVQNVAIKICLIMKYRK